MGLDMYAMTTANAPDCVVDFKPDDPQELHYWRQHAQLHCWMEHLYRLKGGRDESFGSNFVLLELADIDLLEKVIDEGTLPAPAEPHHGEASGLEYADDIAFIAEARAAIKSGKFVIYTSS